MNYSDSFDSDYDSDAFGDAGISSQVQAVGYNSYGRPSMSMNDSHDFHQQSSDENDYGSSRFGSSSDDDEGSGDNGEPTTLTTALPVQPRGKTFRPPVGAGGGSSSSSEDEGDSKTPSSNLEAVAKAQTINSNPGPLRGKELRLIMKGNVASSDDEPLVSKKSKRGAKPKASNGSLRKAAAPKRTAAKASARKSPSKATGSKKRKNAPPPAAHDSDSDSEDEDCVATIVGGSDTEGVMAVAEVIKSNKRLKARDGAVSKRKAPGKKAAAKKAGAASKKAGAASKKAGAASKKAGAASKKVGPKKGQARKQSPAPSSNAAVSPAPVISAEKASAARAARVALQEAVTSLPHGVTASHTVRSFGRIKPEYHVANPLDALYSGPHAIYPVGFSCDRFEFSPVHRRVIKMRCDILDGSTLQRGEGEKGVAMGKDGKLTDLKSDEVSEPMLVDEKAPGENDAVGDSLGDGPIFRVTWGEGVEEDKLLEPSCPFDPYVASAHLGNGDVDAIAVPLSSKAGKPVGLPEVGMRVSVRFEKGKMYGGAIAKVKPNDKKSKNKKSICNITIQYDDGVTEVAAFPDPDIVVAHQGCPPVETSTGLVMEMNGKPVRSVLAKTPLEAWGKTLLSLGLIDEIMYGAALQELQSHRDEGFNEVKDKIDAVNKKRREDRAKEKLRRSNGCSFDGDDDNSQDTDTGCMDKMDSGKEYGREDPSPEEVELHKKLAEVQSKLHAAKKRSKVASLNLANARIATISPFAANPFLFRDDSVALETSWLAAAVKKERAKMGNTGNKRKIVNPATIMDKSDTFFVPKIERLVEGLPGTEFAPSYVFHSNRSSSGNQAWIHEAKLRHQKQKLKQEQKEQQRQQQKQEKARKAAMQAEVKAKVEQERVLKRKLKEEEAADKKRQREEEEEKRRRERVEKRLSQLSLQMNDRLFKEACVMREKNVMNYVRGLNKEFSRRRKAAELAVASKIDRYSKSSPSVNSSSTASILAPFGEMLPPLSRTYDLEVVRIWDFLHSFSNAFSVLDTPISLPTLNSLQDAINCIKTNRCDQKERSDAVELFKGIAIDLCRVISPSLTRTLSSSAPNVEALGKNGTEGGPQENADVSCLPVTELTWREIARMVIINDVLTDLGYSKQESANFVKGYRSGGHPNSKEAKRWKKIEESPVIMMYHRLEQQDDGFDQLRSRVVRANLSTPCTPSCVPSDWRFPLHNIKSRSSHSLRFIKNNVSNALAALKKNSSEVKHAQSYISDLEKCLAVLERSGHGSNNATELNKVKQIAIGVLDSTREKYTPLALKNGEPVSQCRQTHLMTNQINTTQEPARQRMGFQKMYQMSREQFKALEQSKEEYMAAALRLKEELERKNRDEANDDEEDDDDDDDVEDNSQDKSDKESYVSDSVEISNGGAAMTDPRISFPEVNRLEQAQKYSEAATSSYQLHDTTSKTDRSEKANHDEEAVALFENPSSSSAVIENINTTGHSTVSEKDRDIPAEPAEGFPDGWVARRIPRLNPNDKRTDRNWYSPKLGLKFRAKADAMRFLGILESAKGDEAVAIMEYHGKNKTNKVANKGTNKGASKGTKAIDGEIGAAKAEYEFCEDTPLAPDLIRRCLAVIRNLCASNSADQFVYPVDPQLYPAYYETVMNPTSLYDIGKFLQEAGEKYSLKHDDPDIEEVVATVGRKVRTIVHNSICVNSSNNVVNSAEEMLRLFERLFFDWVLAPSVQRPPLEDLDDDLCIDHHESDVNSMVLLCDACEGKYNMTRLKPALDRVPSGDWYCPRCVSGRNWLTADPRIGRKVQNGPFSGTVQSCKFLFMEGEKPSILYRIKSVNSGWIEYWGIQDIDELILGDPVEPLKCVQALAESPGYGFGRESGIVGGVLPLAINPLIGDKAAEAALSSGVFKDTVSVCVSLTNPPEDFTAGEWITLLMLLVTKCSQSDDLQELSSKLENKEASRLSTDMMNFWRARAAKNIIPNPADDDTISSEEGSFSGVTWGTSSDIPSVTENSVKKDDPLPQKGGLPGDVVTKLSGEVSTQEHPTINMDIDIQSSSCLDEASSNIAANAADKISKDVVMSEEDILRRERETAFLAKTRRERKREEALLGYYVGNRLKPAAASFEEDILSTIVKSTLCNQEEGLDLSAVRCRELCHYCGLSDVALGAPLCRTPSEMEWRETFPLSVHDRTTYMIAEIAENSGKGVLLSEENGIKSLPGNPVPGKLAKVLMVRVRLSGELVSSKNKSIDSAVKNFDSAIHQFLPKNPAGFQSELKFRHELNLNIVSGSLAAHEVCAIAAHRSRREELLTERRAFHRVSMTREAALACGKSVPIGTDPFGRSYWVFSAEPKSLFVCQVDSKHGAVGPARKQWHRFQKPEEIAAVMVCLGKDPLRELLGETFPDAAKVVKDRSWSSLLIGRNLHHEPKAAEAPPKKATDKHELVDYGEPFVEDEDVLVESEKGKFLWDAVIVDVSKEPETERVDGYLVHYKNWSSRFDQWVVPDRVVEPNKVNLEVQEEVLQDFCAANDASPLMLEKMFAFKFLDLKKRARLTPASKAEIFDCMVTRPPASHDEKLLSMLKGSVLLIEAALPRGSIGSSPNGSWNPQVSALWRNLVKDAQGPESLMNCVLLLEDAISPDWLHSQATKLYCAIPTQWRAMGEATLSAIALRVSILDRCLKYQQKRKKTE